MFKKKINSPLYYNEEYIRNIYKLTIVNINIGAL